MMPKILAAAAATLAVTAGAAVGSADNSTNPAAGEAAAAPRACATATLKGTYNYFTHGLRKLGKYELPFFEVGHKIYDGRGSVSTVSTNSLRRTTGRQTGTYSIRANCRGRTTHAAKQTQLYVDPTGQGLSFLRTDPARLGGPLGGTEARTSTKTRAQLQCSTQTLKGTFAYHARGLKNRKIYVETGFETYDGQGRLTNTYTDSHARKATHATGTYTIAGDCTGTARYAGGDTYRLYAAPDGSTFSWLQTKGLDRLEYFGGLEHRISATPNYALTGQRAAAGNTPPTLAAGDGTTNTCSAATLQGTYQYFNHGLKRQGKARVPYVEVGHQIYDANGHVATVFTDSLRHTTGRRAGTYLIRPNCRGGASYAATKTHYQLHVDPTGEELSYLVTNRAGPEGALGGTATRASTQTRSELSCSTQTLKGTFAYHARGLKNRKAYIETGFETYDGQGRLTNAYTDSQTRKTLHATGTYTLASDCTGTARYAGGDTYHLYAAPDGSAFSWLQTEDVSTGEFFGGLEHRISATPNYALTGRPAATRTPTISANLTSGAMFRSAQSGCPYEPNYCKHLLEEAQARFPPAGSFGPGSPVSFDAGGSPVFP